MGFLGNCKLRVVLQQATTMGGFSHTAYLRKADDMLKPFNMSLMITDRRMPQFPYLPLELDPTADVDIENLYNLAKKDVAVAPNQLRVIFVRYSMRGKDFYANTPGGQVVPLSSGAFVPNFCIIDVHKRTKNDCCLLHEMIHATGLSDHDPDPTAVFAVGIDGERVLSDAYAERLSKSFFSDRNG
jgi:hypothetical protein